MIELITGSPGTGKTTFAKDVYDTILYKKQHDLSQFSDSRETHLICTDIFLNLSEPDQSAAAAGLLILADKMDYCDWVIEGYLLARGLRKFAEVGHTFQSDYTLTVLSEAKCNRFVEAMQKGLEKIIEDFHRQYKINKVLGL